MSTISWYGLKVAPQTELKVQRILHQRERPALAPVELVKRTRERADGRTNTVERQKPIFPGYVFLGLGHPAEVLAERDFINRFETRPVVFGLIGFGGRPIPLTPSDVVFMLTIADKLAANTPIEISAIQIGTQVKIRQGHAFEGHGGRVVELKGKKRARARVMLQAYDRMPVVEVRVADLVAA